MSKQGLLFRVACYLLVIVALIFFVAKKQKAIIAIRESTVVSPITEWEQAGKPVEILCVARRDFYMFTRLTVEKVSGTQYVGYITQDEKETLLAGQKIYYNANTDVLCGVVDTISAERDFDKGLFQVTVDLGQSTRSVNGREIIFIQTGIIDHVIQLPNEVLDTDGSRMFVWTVINDILFQTFIELGTCGRETSIITSGVKEGDRVVMHGSALASVGDRVCVRKEIKQ